MLHKCLLFAVLAVVFTASGTKVFSETLLSRYEFNGDLFNSSTFVDSNGISAPDGLFREGADSTTAVAGTPAFTMGVDGTPSGAILLDGNDDWVDVTTAGHPGEPVPLTFDSGLGLVRGTVMAWVKTSASLNAVSRWLMDSANSADFQAFRLGWNGAQIEAVAQAADTPASQFAVEDTTHTTTWADGSWHHIAVNWNGQFDVGNVFVDGQPVGATLSPGATLTSSNTQAPWEFPMAIGALDNGGTLQGFWEGAIDDLQIHSDALSDAQILEEFNSVTIFTPSDADFDQDGDVDGADFLIWQRNFGTGTTLAQGDADSSGGVDNVDLMIWETQFAAGAGQQPNLHRVPEPSSLTLMLLAAISALFATRTGQKSGSPSPLIQAIITVAHRCTGCLTT